MPQVRGADEDYRLHPETEGDHPHIAAPQDVADRVSKTPIFRSPCFSLQHQPAAGIIRLKKNVPYCWEWNIYFLNKISTFGHLASGFRETDPQEPTSTETHRKLTTIYCNFIKLFLIFRHGAIDFPIST